MEHFKLAELAILVPYLSSSFFLNISIGHRDGGDKHIPRHHLYPHLIILILNTHPISNNFCISFFLQWIPLLHNNLIVSTMKILPTYIITHTNDT